MQPETISRALPRCGAIPRLWRARSRSPPHPRALAWELFQQLGTPRLRAAAHAQRSGVTGLRRKAMRRQAAARPATAALAAAGAASLHQRGSLEPGATGALHGQPPPDPTRVRSARIGRCPERPSPHVCRSSNGGPAPPRQRTECVAAATKPRATGRRPATPAQAATHVSDLPGIS